MIPRKTKFVNLPNVAPGELIEPPEEKKRKRKPVTKVTPKSDGGPDHNIGVNYDANVHDIPRPWIFRYPNEAGDRQSVKVRIDSFRGFAFGASHYYAKVDVEENSIWDPKELVWKVGRLTPECKKTEYHAHVFTRGEAIDFIDMVVTRWFLDTKRYNVHTDYSEDNATREDVKKEISRDVDDV